MESEHGVDLSLSDHVSIVTGAAGGIGTSISRLLARAGATVILADVRGGEAEALANRMRGEGHAAEAVAVDIRSVDSTRAMISWVLDRFGRVDDLVNNAGVDAPRGNAWEMDPEHWNDIIDTDLSGAWWCTRAVVPHMISRGRGRVVFISSISARRASLTVSAAYSAAKAGLIGLTIALSAQLEPHGILVNAIAPGPTGTGDPMTDQEWNTYHATFPLGIVGPDPVAWACLYLLGPSGDWVSGAVLNVSGGGWRG